MTDVFVGEIQMFGFNFPPKNFLLCNGQLLPIAQYQALFALIGTTYGGNGVSNFQLPNLQGRLPMGQGNGPGLTPRVMGEFAGEENHTLLPTENPQHTHAVQVIPNPTLANNTDVPGPTQVLAQTSYTGTKGAITNVYVADSAPTVPMSSAAVSFVGGQPHSNLMPLLAVNFSISLFGVFPSRN